MLNDSKVFSSFSTDNIAKAKEFYGDTLGLDVREEGDMGLNLQFAGGASCFIYPKDDHQPASHTVLNFVVDNIDNAVEGLKGKGIEFEEIDFGNGAKTDEKGVMRGKSVSMGPDIAWFKDPAGNTLSVLEE